ncbi:unnamed protein product [Linum tenue]|uniref:TIR domain-containing protein n=1 Tax=Linum tenue TaxID=586396 RepID=A0AAV0QH97_9ROSI|nr:unnamed protein product [Linum tenue]
MDLKIWTIWSFFWQVAVAVTSLVVAVTFLLKKKKKNSKPSDDTPKSSESESSGAEQQQTSSTPCSWPVEYEVFLSFRGPDVRANFADFLHKFLVRYKIRTFLDDEELRKGEKIAPSLVKAIEESKVYIPVLSPNYARSKWCLQELAQMMKCCNQGNGHIMLPIFFMVEPRDVRRQDGPYKAAFQHHRKKYDAETIDEWKEALQEVGAMKGWHITESDGQGAIIDEVVAKVWSHLTQNYTLVTDELIGIDSHVEEVTNLLNLGCEGVKIIGIYGMGGIGKTTIAKAVYNKVQAQLDHYIFVEDVREILVGHDGAINLQSKIISGILRIDYKVKDASEGIRVIRERICKRRALIVLDDVDDRFEFDLILGKLDDFSSETRIIITTRNKRVLDVLQEFKLYEPGEMSPDHALQLFNKHAFGTDNPQEEEAILSEEFVKVATGLPLALKVVGSLLFRQDREFWQAKLIELKDLPPTKVQERLKISYNELSYNEKQIFLDIACSFIGENKVFPLYMWTDCKFYPESGIKTLVLRCLIKFNERNEFWMHDHVRDLGRAIIHEEDNQRPWKRSRICSNEDAFDMLEREEGSDLVEVLRVNMADENLQLTDQVFKKFSGLRYLEVQHGRLTGDFKGILPSIRWLRLHECSSIPIDLNLNKLVILDMHSCPVEDDWRGWGGIKVTCKLKAINLSFCGELTTAPNLSHCRSLEFIHFWTCWEMRGELHVGSFKNLKVLSLTMTKITKLNGDFARLKNLQEIVAGHLTQELEEVAALPPSLKQLALSSSRVPNLSELRDLEHLSFERCDQLEIPGDIWKLSKLTTLELWDSSFSNSGIIVSVFPSSLKSLLISGCEPLEKLPSLANLNNLKELRLMRVQVHEVQGLGDLRMLETLVISSGPNLGNLDGLENLLLLKTLKVENCCLLKELPSLSNLTKLQLLEISSCQLLSEIQGLGEPEECSLSSLYIIDCPSLANTGGLLQLARLRKLVLYAFETDGHHLSSREQFLDVSGLRDIEELLIFGYKQLTKVYGLEKLETLRSLSISDCTSVRELPDLSGLKNLKNLNIVDCSSIAQLPNLSRFVNLKSLQISRCTRLSEVKGLERLEWLEYLSMSGCSWIKELPDLSGLENVVTLDISGCTGLTEVVGLENLEALQALQMANCKSIKQLPDLSGLKHLRELDITGCTQLAEVAGVHNFEGLVIKL